MCIGSIVWIHQCRYLATNCTKVTQLIIYFKIPSLFNVKNNQNFLLYFRFNLTDNGISFDEFIAHFENNIVNQIFPSLLINKNHK